MILSNPLIAAALLFALLGLIFLFTARAALKKRKVLSTAMNFVIAFLMPCSAPYVLPFRGITH